MAVKRMLADVLWEAANLHLSAEGGGHDEPRRPALRFSCNTISRALGMEGVDDDTDWFLLPEAVHSLLLDLGCDPDACNLLNHIESELHQGVRYMWLLLAMHVAEDEGITV